MSKSMVFRIGLSCLVHVVGLSWAHAEAASYSDHIPLCDTVLKPLSKAVRDYDPALTYLNFDEEVKKVSRQLGETDRDRIFNFLVTDIRMIFGQLSLDLIENKDAYQVNLRSRAIALRQLTYDREGHKYNALSILRQNDYGKIELVKLEFGLAAMKYLEKSSADLSVQKFLKWQNEDEFRRRYAVLVLGQTLQTVFVESRLVSYKIDRYDERSFDTSSFKRGVRALESARPGAFGKYTHLAFNFVTLAKINLLRKKLALKVFANLKEPQSQTSSETQNFEEPRADFFQLTPLLAVDLAPYQADSLSVDFFDIVDLKGFRIFKNKVQTAAATSIEYLKKMQMEADGLVRQAKTIQLPMNAQKLYELRNRYEAALADFESMVPLAQSTLISLQAATESAERRSLNISPDSPSYEKLAKELRQNFDTANISQADLKLKIAANFESVGQLIANLQLVLLK